MLAEGRQDPILTLSFPLAERKGESLLVWTTAPFVSVEDGTGAKEAA
jgi:isoleucyl-tRNA synthetase